MQYQVLGTIQCDCSREGLRRTRGSSRWTRRWLRGRRRELCNEQPFILRLLPLFFYLLLPSERLLDEHSLRHFCDHCDHSGSSSSQEVPDEVVVEALEDRKAARQRCPETQTRIFRRSVSWSFSPLLISDSTNYMLATNT